MIEMPIIRDCELKKPNKKSLNSFFGKIYLNPGLEYFYRNSKDLLKNFEKKISNRKLKTSFFISYHIIEDTLKRNNLKIPLVLEDVADVFIIKMNNGIPFEKGIYENFRLEDVVINLGEEILMENPKYIQTLNKISDNQNRLQINFIGFGLYKLIKNQFEVEWLESWEKDTKQSFKN